MCTYHFFFHLLMFHFDLFWESLKTQGKRQYYYDLLCYTSTIKQIKFPIRMPGILDRSMKSFLSAVQFVLMLSNNDRNLYICNKKVYSQERCEGCREELKSQSKCFVHTCSPNLVLNPISSRKMYVNPSNFLQIIILTTGVKRCPPYQVITCLVPLERTLTLTGLH